MSNSKGDWKKLVADILEKHSTALDDRRNGICWPEENAELVENLVSLLTSAYQKGWQDRDKDYQDIGEQPPEAIQQAEKAAVEEVLKKPQKSNHWPKPLKESLYEMLDNHSHHLINNETAYHKIRKIFTLLGEKE